MFFQKLRNVFPETSKPFFRVVRHVRAGGMNKKRQPCFQSMAVSLLGRCGLGRRFGRRFAGHRAFRVFDGFQDILELLAGIEERQDADDLAASDIFGNFTAIGGRLQPERAEITQLDDIPPDQLLGDDRQKAFAGSHHSGIRR